MYNTVFPSRINQSNFMKQFKFIQNAVHEMWLRRFFTVKAESYDKALQIALKYKNVELEEEELDPDDDTVVLDSDEWLYDTESPASLSVENMSTIEILDRSKDVIANNAASVIFRQFERVFHCSYDDETHGWGVIVRPTVLTDDVKTVQVILDDTGAEIEADASKLYRLSTDFERCPRCGRLLCKEHNPDVDYKYYCPQCDENFG